MRQAYSIVMVFVFALFSGCVARSLNPVLTEGQAVAVPSLVGTWIVVEDAAWPPVIDDGVAVDDVGEEEQAVWAIEAAGDDGVHDLTSFKIGKDGEFVPGATTRAGLSLAPEQEWFIGHATLRRQDGEAIDDSYKLFLRPIYYPLQVEFDLSREWMAISFLDSEAIEAAMEEGTLSIDCVQVNGDVVIAASSDELRAYMQSVPPDHVDGPVVFRRSNVRKQAPDSDHKSP